MLLRQNQVRVLLVTGFTTFCVSMGLVLYLATKGCGEAKICNCQESVLPSVDLQNRSQTSGHKLCIIVPFKDRFQELLEFAPYIKNFLQNQEVENDIWVINQVDSLRFNRASLINVGFKESSEDGCDYIAMHDVDLLPVNTDLIYKFPENGPLHIASPELHPKYDYPTFIGGILLISRNHFKLVDGMSNKYWGWGLEDDEFFVRLRQENLAVERPKGIRSGKSGTFKHVHNKKVRRRDEAKCYNQRNATRRRDRQTGMSNVMYKVASKRKLTLDGSLVNFLDIELECERGLTPWCNCTGAPPDKGPVDRTRDDDVVVPLLPKKKKKVKT